MLAARVGTRVLRAPGRARRGGPGAGIHDVTHHEFHPLRVGRPPALARRLSRAVGAAVGPAVVAFAVPLVARSSLVFGSIHLGNYTGSVVGVVAGALLIAAVGGAFGALYERPGNLAVPATVHALYNALPLGVGSLG